MPIARGEDWGWEADASGPWPTCGSDAELAAAIEAGIEIVELTGGDVARTLGITSAGPNRTAAWHAPLDALRVWVDDEQPIIAAAHVRIGSWTSRGGWQAAMNAAFVGDQNLAPRAHPGDGLADVVTMSLSGSDRYKARHRVRTGTHVPHPGIKVRRTASETLAVLPRQRVRVDHRPPVKARTVRIEVVSAAIVAAF